MVCLWVINAITYPFRETCVRKGVRRVVALQRSVVAVAQQCATHGTNAHAPPFASPLS